MPIWAPEMKVGEGTNQGYMQQIKLEIRDAGPLKCDAALENPSERELAAALEALRDCLQCLPVGTATGLHNALLKLLEQGNIAYELVAVQHGIATWAFAFDGDTGVADPLVRIVRDPVGRKILHAFIGRELYLQLTQDQPFPVFLLSERLFASLETSRREARDGDGVADGLNQPLGRAA